MVHIRYYIFIFSLSINSTLYVVNESHSGQNDLPFLVPFFLLMRLNLIVTRIDMGRATIYFLFFFFWKCSAKLSRQIQKHAVSVHKETKVWRITYL